MSQVLLVIATPLLTRLYSPSDFGNLALFVSIVVLVAPVSTMKYDQAILLPKDREGAETVSMTALWGSVLASGAILLGMLILQVAAVIHLRWFFFLVPAVLPVVALVSVAQQWSSREKRFSDIGAALFVNAVVNVVLSCLFFAIGMSSAGLVLSYTLGFLASAIYFCLRAGTPLPNLGRHLAVRTSEIKAIVLQYRDFPLYVLPNVILGYLSYQMMPFLITHFFNTTTTGLYSVANRLVVLPSILVGQVLGEVFRSEFITKLHSNTDYRRFFEKALSWMVVLAIPVYGSILWLSPILFHIVFGEKFVLAGDYAQWICLGVAGIFFVQMFSYVLIALDKTRAGLLFQAVLSAGQVGGFLFGALRHDIRVALIGMSVVSFVLSVFFIFFAYATVVAATKGRSAPGL